VLAENHSAFDTRIMNQTLALAGVIQASSLVEQVAKTGSLDQEPFETCIYSLFQQNPETTEAVFKDRSSLHPGLKELIKILENQQGARESDTVKYAMSVIHLQKRLSFNKDMLNIISSRLKQARSQAEHFSLTHENVISNLASIYQDSISTFRFRVQVTGTMHYLQQPTTAAKVRTLLLCGVRAAMLWRQVGGNRWQFLFKRRQILQCAQELLK